MPTNTGSSKTPNLVIEITVDRQKFKRQIETAQFAIEKSAVKHGQKLSQIDATADKKRSIQKRTAQDKLNQQLFAIQEKARIKQEIAQKKSQARQLSRTKSWSAKMTSSLTNISRGLGVMAAAWGAMQIRMMIKGTIDFAGEIATASESVGLTVETFSALSSAAISVGKDMGAVTRVAQTLNRVLADAERLPKGIYAKQFEAMGIDTQQDIEKIIADLIEVNDLGQLSLILGDRNAVVLQRIGDRYKNLNGVMTENAVLTGDTAKRLDDIGAAWGRFGFAMKVGTAEAIVGVADLFKSMGDFNEKFGKDSLLLTGPPEVRRELERQRKLAESEKKLAGERKKNIEELTAQQLAAAKAAGFSSIAEQLAAEAAAVERKVEAEKEHAKEVSAAIKIIAERNKLALEAREIRDSETTGGVDNTAGIEKNRQRFIALMLDRRNEREKFDDETDKLAEKATQEFLKAEDARIKQVLEKEKAFRDEQVRLAEEASRTITQIQDQAVQLASSAFNFRSTMMNNEIEHHAVLMDQTQERWALEEEKMRAFGMEETNFNRRRVLANEKTLKQQQAKELDLKSKAFGMDKTARASETIMNTSLAVMRAYTAAAPPLGTILAALVAATGGVQLATVLGQKNPYKRRFGGDVPGTGFQDSTLVLATPGEKVMNREAVRSNNEILELMNQGINPQQGNTITINVDGDIVDADDFVRTKMIPALNEATRDGFALNN